MASILLLDKREGITSFGALSPVKRTIDRKCGHAGTLDKFASGLLIVLTGRMTRLNQIFSNLDKRYRAVVQFGTETSTLDPEGEVVKTAELPDPEKVRSVIASDFTGTVMQTPPVCSAIHINGKRAYKRMRAGEKVEMPSRKVTLSDWNIISVSEKEIEFEVTVSKGTYIRSLGRDIALKAGSRGHVVSLRRLSIGPYSVDEAQREVEDLDPSLTLERLLRLDCVRIGEIDRKYRKLMDNGTFVKQYTPLDGKTGARYMALMLDGELRYLTDLQNERIVCQIPGTP